MGPFCYLAFPVPRPRAAWQAAAARRDVGVVEAMERELLALWERHRELEAKAEA